MTVLSVYIFRKDGVPLFSTFYDPQIQTVDGLATPFFASISNRLKDMIGESLEKISLSEDCFLIMEEFGEINAVAVCRGDEDLSFKLNMLARRFYKMYHHSIMGKNWKGKLDYFDDFIPILEDILEIDNKTTYAELPTKPLDTFVLTEYPKGMQELIKKLIQKREMSLIEIKKFKLEQINAHLTNLIEQGYVGRKFVEDTEYYFISN